MKQRLVIVGGGQAAAQAVQTARQLGHEGPITLVGEEPYPPYQRPPLSKKYLSREMERERLFLKSDSFYEDRDVELLTGKRAEELMPDTQRVRLDDGRTLEYDLLLLATGSSARRLKVDGSELAGLHYLRSIADVDAIMSELEPGRAVTIIGAGYIGLEVAAVCRKLGAKVTVLEAADRPMSRVVSAETAAFFDTLHRQAGVELVYDAIVTRLEGRDRIEEVVTSDGRRYRSDLVIAGIGIEANVSLAEKAGLACNDGILVDECGRTADPQIAAAGDCTRQTHPWAGTSVRLESVHNAIEQGKAAVSSLLGSPAPFKDVPWFWSDQYDVKLQIVGLAQDYDQTVVRGDIATGSFSVFYLRSGRLLAIDAVRRPRDFLLGKQLLPSHPIVPVDAIRDTEFDLSTLVAPAPTY